MKTTVRRKTQNVDSRAKLLLDAAADFHVLTDRDGKILLVNDAFAKQFGHKSRELTGKYLFDIVAPDTVDRRRQIINDVLRTGQSIVFEEQYHGLMYEYRITPIIKRKKITALATFVRDITILKLAEGRLVKTIEDCRAITDSAADCMLIAVGNGAIVYSNQAASDLLGYSLAEIKNCNLKDLTQTEKLAVAARQYRDIIKGRPVPLQYEMVFASKSKTPIPVDMVAVRTVWQGQIAVTVIFRESARRLTAEKIMRESEETANALLNASTDSAMLMGEGGIILAVNQVGAARLGAQYKDFVGSCIYNYFPPDVAQKRRVRLEEAFAFARPMQFEDEQEGRYIRNSVYPIVDVNGRVSRIAVFSRDITAKKQAQDHIRTYQQQLRSLASELLLTEEKERRSIANDLHDQIGHTLAIIKMKLAGLPDGDTSDRAAVISQLSALLNQAINYSRTLTAELSLPVLYDLGLEAALEWLAEQTQQQTGITVRFHDDERSKPASEEIRVLLYRAVRELIMNIRKHARATEIDLSISRQSKNIIITISDNGQGFDATKVLTSERQASGYGLLNIRERLRYIGGRMEIDSGPGSGTRVKLVLPIKLTDQNTVEKKL